MQSRFIKELPESRYELLNVHSHYGRQKHTQIQHGEILVVIFVGIDGCPNHS